MYENLGIDYDLLGKIRAYDLYLFSFTGNENFEDKIPFRRGEL